MNPLSLPNPVYSPEAGGALAAAAGAESGTPSPGVGDDKGGGPTPPGDGADAWTPPQGLPDSFRGATADETLGKLLGGYTELNTRAEGLRTQLARLPKAPDKPENYTFKASEKLAPYFGEDNKSLDFARQAFHKHGIPDAAFQGIIEDIYTPMIDAGLLPAPFNPQKELSGFMTATGLDKTATVAALDQNLTFAKGLSGQLKGVPESMKAEVDAALLALTDTAAGNVLIQALSGRLNEAGIRVTGQGGLQGAMSEADLRRLAGDPRIDPANREHPDPNKRFDPQLRERYDAAYRSLPERTVSF